MDNGLVWEPSSPETLEVSPRSPAVGAHNVFTYDDLCEHEFAFLHLHILEKIKATVPSLSNAQQQDFCMVLDIGCKSTVAPGVRVCLSYTIEDAYSLRSENGHPELPESRCYQPCRICGHRPGA
eukprot:2152886-Rhodomonas_salina.1